MVSRRALARGAAWAIPALVVASPAPAFAASAICKPVLTSSGGLTYNWGTLGATSTTQTMTAGAETYVDNLPPGVTVKQVTYEWWIENRDGQSSPGPGAFWVGNSWSNRAGETKSAMPYTPGPGTAWRSTVANTDRFISKVFPDGVTRPAFDLRFDWTAGRNNSTGTMTQDAGGCFDFKTGPSGRFEVIYTGVVAPSSCPGANAGKYTIKNFNIVTVTLSDGTILTATFADDGGATCKL